MLEDYCLLTSRTTVGSDNFFNFFNFFNFWTCETWISLHAAGYAERSAYGSKYSDNHLQDSFPNFLFHFLFSFLFLMVKQSVFLVVNSVFLWMTMQRYNIFLGNAIVVPNHVHSPCFSDGEGMQRGGWNCVATQPGLRRHVSPATSGRNLGYVGTQFGGKSVELIVCSTEHQRMYVKAKMWMWMWIWNVFQCYLKEKRIIVFK